MADEKVQKRYFIAKVNNFPSLRRAVQTSQWACAFRTTPPQPQDILTQAYTQGTVIIIFSVSNCHGWHGYAEMLNVPGEASKRTEGTAEASRKAQSSCNTSKEIINADTTAQRAEDVNNYISEHSESISVSQDSESSQIDVNTGSESKISHPKFEYKNLPGKSSEFLYFDINWKLNYQDFGEQCLNSKMTEDLYCIENLTGNKIQVNKCRNWQEVESEVGVVMCEKMQELYDNLCKKRDEKKLKEVECLAEPFYKETKVLTVQETWMKIVTQVEQELGKVLLACPFGSQRYNLHTPSSDTDMFIVYQARTSDILSFHPPKQTIKNHESESCDYTIHEVYRYCELLLSGDARCVETLFLHESTVVQASQEWHILKQGRKMLLNKECLEKYLRDAQGSKGTKFLQKWFKDHTQEEVLPPKMCKMVYVIVRLLQNARDIANGEDLKVYREIGSSERDTLMTIRAGNVPVLDAWKIINELETSIVSKSEQVKQRSEDAERFLEDWLLTLRYNNFQKLN
ncbi:uncharacterized protein LOC123536344 isoform X2 [Mercenaria mercenaria]|nr:uncharacterized protein LOC123536344 isoform X2 [Mercenaria mercenaria]XP_045175398.2 uncharacterized protein LOC123536344 isoform X2 [Mercenaria mercenaria]XP_045175399.2 uncharacterized protein LOC123536344 isoform X2 [Mercenaria mercenaria]XP_045175400.2 uncharacterized protein LOC123536344 isoform X2 [Mercenaria mercenaria]XP_053384463.1 uncharacterized protein LOC123536344 isoform X2 [Mercenaria mercenaria]XP_053384465.1 uncharacterized protein LOC123536344 isoform X2 [Mercenaria merce